MNIQLYLSKILLFKILTKIMNDDEFVNVEYNWKDRVLIGEGSFGKVFKVLNIKTGQEIAIKQLPMSKFDQDFKRKALLTQIQLQKELSGPYSVKYFTHQVGKIYTYIFTQLCEKDLKAKLFQNDNKLPQSQCAKIFGHIAQGFKMIIDKGYIHRDVKPQNVLIKNNIYKIADFGFSKKIDIQGEAKITDICGTPLYMAPQMLLHQEYTAKCDLWSLGLMLYEMLFGFGPWPTRHQDLYKQNILTKPVGFPYGADIGYNTWDLIKKCLQVRQQDRISWKQFFEHPFVTKQDLGPKIQFKKLNQDVILILRRVQQSCRRKGIDIFTIFNKYSEQKLLEKDRFDQFLRRLDPQITTYESQVIFKNADQNQDKSVHLQQFKKIFCDVDYRPPQDVVGRKIQQIVGIAQARNINIKELFQMFDSNKSGTIEKTQFVSFIRKIAPKISLQLIIQMWTKLDSDKSGYISYKQFLNEMTLGTLKQQSVMTPNRQRAKRNLSCLRAFLFKNNITPQMMISKIDIDNSRTITINQFGPMIQKINYVITKQEIKDMFEVLDVNHSGSIQFNQLIQYFNSK